MEDRIENILLSREAKELNITTDSLLSFRILQSKISYSLEQFIDKNGLKSGVVRSEQPFRLIPLDTKEGQDVLADTYKMYVRNEYLKELKQKYRVKIHLKPPLTPTLDMSGLVSNSRGNTKSDRSIWIISDFSCSACRENHKGLERVFNELQDDFHFKYVSYSADINPEIKFVACSAKQGKFGQAYNLLFESASNGEMNWDKLGSQIKIDTAACQACMNTFDEKPFINNIARLQELNIVSTPTVVIDDRIYYGQLTLTAIEKYIEDTKK